MWTRTVTFGVWAAVAASALFWGLKLWVQAPPAPPQTQLAQAGNMARGDLSRLLGVDAAPVLAGAAPEPTADERFNLIGVVSPRQPKAGREGLALISVDGKPPKAYRVGALVDGPHVLQSVSARGVSLGPAGGTSMISLNLAPPASAATGQLPGATSNPGSYLPPGVPPRVPPRMLTPPPAQRAPPQIPPPPPMTAPPNTAPEGGPLR